MILALTPLLLIVVLTSYGATFLRAFGCPRFAEYGLSFIAQIVFAEMVANIGALVFGTRTGATAYQEAQRFVQLIAVLVAFNISLWPTYSFLRKQEFQIVARWGAIRDTRNIVYPEVLFFAAFIPATISLWFTLPIMFLVGLIKAILTGGAFL